MNGLEFARCTTAGRFERVLVHAAPGQAQLEVRAEDGTLVAAGDLERQGEYSPMTLITREGSVLRREEVWPDEALYGMPVLLCGGEVGRLLSWEAAGDHSWWRWQVEFSNHKQRPSDWEPPAS